MNTIEYLPTRVKKPESNYQALIVLALFLFAFIARLLSCPRTIDDSSITFRYARNILAGNGFVYNPGERVLGTTTPLYTLLLTDIGLLIGGRNAPYPNIALIVNAFVDGATCVLLYLTGRHLKAPIPGLGAALVWATAPFSVTFAIGGLETSIYVLLLVSTVYSYLRGRHRWTALTSALALLTKPDALFLVAPLALDRL